jgi:hypothetical protein
VSVNNALLSARSPQAMRAAAMAMKLIGTTAPMRASALFEETGHEKF